jgi:hypothetical protein
MVAAAVASGALLLAVALVLAKSGHHRTWTTGHARAVAPALPPKTEMCQAGQLLYEGTGRIGFHGQGIAGPFEVSVLDAPDHVVARGRLPGGVFHPWNRTPVRIPEIRRDIENATVCIRNAGEGTLLVYGQEVREPAPGATLPTNVRQPPGIIALRLDYLEPRSRSWWSFAPEVADRYGLVKATMFGSWTLWAVVAALVALAIGAIWYTARALAR